MLDIDICVRQGRFQLNIQTCIADTGITAIYGPSGCGKTTLLRAIAGLTPIQTGSIQFRQVCWHGQRDSMPVHRRQLGYVFQENSLLRHLNVAQNLAFAQQRQPQLDTGYQQDLIELLGLQELLKRYPTELSLGEQQRVAIACALLSKPQLLLMDEPLASLDSERKQRILQHLKHRSENFNLPILYVSHHLGEIATLADHLLIIEDGALTEQGPVNTVINAMAKPALITVED